MPLDPSTSLKPAEDYYKRVATVHEKGGYGSIGYRTPWSDEESHKLLLRTHTTASSAAMLYKLAAKCRDETGTSTAAEGDGFRPAKLFSIDRVFRNETMDATHLAEFHQVEGVVADRNLTLADLIGEPGMHPARLDIQFHCRVYEGLLQKDGHNGSSLQAGL